MPLGTEVDLGPCDIVLYGDPASPINGTAPPLFGPCLLSPNGQPSQLLLSSCFLSFYGRPYILPCGFFYLLSFFFLFSSLILAVADWMSTILPHMVWPYSANLGCRSETCCTRFAEIQDAKIAKKYPSGHHRTTMSGYIFATKARIDNRKKTC